MPVVTSLEFWRNWEGRVMWQKTLKLLSALIGVGAIALTVLDLFDLVDIQNYGVSLIIFLLSLLILDFSLSLSAKTDQITFGIDEIRKTNPRTFAQYIDPDIREIMDGYIVPEISNLQNLVNNNTYELRDLSLFNQFYHNTLMRFPKCSFLATSDLQGTKFWNDETNTFMKEFTEKGGKISRLFFSSEPVDALGEEATRVLDQQAAAGVKCILTPTSRMALSNYSNFIVEESGRIGWIVRKYFDGNIYQVEISSDRERNLLLVDKFNSLRRAPAVKDWN